MPERHKRAFEEYLRGRDTKKLFKGVRIDTPYGERKIIKCLPDRELLRITKDLAAEKSLYTMDADQSGHIRDREKKLIKQFEGVLAETFAHIALMCLLPQVAVDRFDLEREDFRYDVKEYDVRLRCGGQIYKFEVRNSNNYKTAIGEGYGSLDVLGAYVNKYKTRETLADYFIRPLLQSETLCPELPDHKNADELAEKLLGGRMTQYLCCGTDRKTMQEKGRVARFGQDARYLAVKMRETEDIADFFGGLKAKFSARDK